MTRIIAIVGPSGAGKDTSARLLAEMMGVHVLCSYTTRKMREGEQDGREHFFVQECDVPQSELLAYTKFGGCEYWVRKDQVKDMCLYVIDEDGLRDMERRNEHFDIVKIHIETTRFNRLMRGVSRERMNRDDLREMLPLDSFDYCIHNNGSVQELECQLRAIAEELS